MTSLSGNLRDRTIQDFGDQWTRYTGNEGYYGSVELFRDICGPLVPIAEFAGARVADIGSGSGLGLPMVQGFAAQSGGAVQIHSQPGQGTTVELWLPRSDAPPFEPQSAVPNGCESTAGEP